MYKLIEYSDNHSKTSGILWQHCWDESALDTNVDIDDFNAANATTNSFILKAKMTGQTGNNDTKKIEVIVPLQYLSNFCITPEMPLIKCNINLDLNWSKKCITVATALANQDATFPITDAKHFVPVVTLSTQDNAKLLKQLKSCFKRTFNWNKYQSKISTERPNQYLDYLIDPSFQGVNRIFVLSFESNAHWTSYNQYFLPTVEIKD